jgi:hypothetical protein
MLACQVLNGGSIRCDLGAHARFTRLLRRINQCRALPFHDLDPVRKGIAPCKSFREAGIFHPIRLRKLATSGYSYFPWSEISGIVAVSATR